MHIVLPKRAKERQGHAISLGGAGLGPLPRSVPVAVRPASALPYPEMGAGERLGLPAGATAGKIA